MSERGRACGQKRGDSERRARSRCVGPAGCFTSFTSCRTLFFFPFSFFHFIYRGHHLRCSLNAISSSPPLLTMYAHADTPLLRLPRSYQPQHWQDKLLVHRLVSCLEVRHQSPVCSHLCVCSSNSLAPFPPGLRSGLPRRRITICVP